MCAREPCDSRASASKRGYRGPCQHVRYKEMAAAEDQTLPEVAPVVDPISAMEGSVSDVPHPAVAASPPAEAPAPASAFVLATCSPCLPFAPGVIAPVPHLAGVAPAVAELHTGGVGVAGSLSLPVVSNPGSANANLAGGVGPAVAEVPSGEVAQRVYALGIKRHVWRLMVEGPSSTTVAEGPEQEPPAGAASKKRRNLPWGNKHDSAPTGAEELQISTKRPRRCRSPLRRHVKQPYGWPSMIWPVFRLMRLR